MKSKYKISIFAFSFINLIFSQVESKFNLTENDEHSCVSEVQYQKIFAEINKNKKDLGIVNFVSQKTDLTSVLEWPLRTSTDYSECGYFYISAFVDMNTNAGQIQDYNCGSRTYDGHRGVDFVAWPFIWDKMDNNYIEVIAAAPGIITAKFDGNPDRICNGIGGGGTSNNYITVQHEDGSTALYIHMKTGSLTNKSIGETVEVGEYLGIVGSAGQSTGPHLHFEIRSDGTFANYIDPFFGTCNSNISESLWVNQVEYSTPEVLKASIHHTWPYMGVCPITQDTMYEQTTFSINDDFAFFNAYGKHIQTNNVWTFEILNPDNSLFSTWSYTCLDNRNTISLGWEKELPNIPGIYQYKASFNGSSCTKSFEIIDPFASQQLIESDEFYIYPNPCNKEFKISFKENMPIIEITLKDQYGREVKNVDFENVNEVIIGKENLANGIYFITFKTSENSYFEQKIIFQE